MKPLYKLNIAAGMAFAVAYCFNRLNFPYLAYPIGLFVFFLPGANLTAALEQLTGLRQRRLSFSLWTFILSLLLNGLPVYAFLLSRTSWPTENLTILLFVLWWALTLVLALLFQAWKRQASGLQRFFEPRAIARHLPFWWSIIFYVLIMSVHFLLYRFIPEADPYTYLLKLQAASDSHAFSPIEARPIFLTTLWTLGYLTKIPFYWLFKITLPLFGMIFIPIFYDISRRYTNDRATLVMGSLAFLCFPVIVLELLIPRPQSLFLFSLPVSIFLATQTLAEKRTAKNVYWLLSLLFVACIGWRIHQFFIFEIILAGLALVAFCWHWIFRFPFEAFLFACILMLGLWPWLNSLGLVFEFHVLGSLFENAFSHARFIPWFISGYTNVDGNQVGWPGLSWIFYYGYNLGLALPFLAMLMIARKKRFSFDWKSNWLYAACFSMFLIIAEILPRLGLAYLPDRAWLFAACMLAMLIPGMLASLQKRWPGRAINGLFIALFSLSLFSGWAITYAKQGWVSPAEYEAAQFLRQTAVSNSLVISQPGNIPLINYFAGQVLVVPGNQFFRQPTGNEALAYISQPLPDPQSVQIVKFTGEQDAAAIAIEKDLVKLDTSDKAELSGTLLNDISHQIGIYQNAVQQIKNSESLPKAKQGSVYILYSDNKFTGLYGQRPWWQALNYKDAEISTFSERPDVYQPVYQRNGVTVWKVNTQLSKTL